MVLMPQEQRKLQARVKKIEWNVLIGLVRSAVSSSTHRGQEISYFFLHLLPEAVRERELGRHKLSIF